MHGDMPGALGRPGQDARLLLVFDGRCGVCTRLADWLERRAPAGRVKLLPSQTPGLAEALRLTRADLDRAAWAVDQQGRACSGAEAINRVLRELPAPWPIVARLYAVPGVRWCQDVAYRWFARHRGSFHRWGVTPACDRPGSSCADGVSGSEPDRPRSP